VSEFFTTNSPDPHHWTLNSCLGAFYSVWVHLGPFCYCTKLDAKQAEMVQLMQKFVPQSRIKNLCNERSRSTPLDTELIFWCISFRLGAFGIVWLLARNLVQNGQPGEINAKVHATPLDPKLMVWCVSFYLGAFGTISLLHETRWIRANLLQLMQKLVTK
jgi:hypothetical protein